MAIRKAVLLTEKDCPDRPGQNSGEHPGEKRKRLTGKHPGQVQLHQGQQHVVSCTLLSNITIQFVQYLNIKSDYRSGKG